MSFFSKLINTYKKGTAYDGLFKEFQELLKIISVERKQFSNVIDGLENENILMYKDLEECTLELSETHTEPIVDTFDLEGTLGNLLRLTGSRAFKYDIRGDGNKVSIKYSLVVKDQDVVSLYGDKIYNSYSPKNPLECVEAVTKYFLYKKRPIYVRDNVQFGKRDYWNPADKFLKTFRGDCEDWSVAMHLLIKYLLDKIDCSEHYKRLYLHVNDNYLEPHANNLWLHNDGFFYTIESSIDPKGTFKKKWLKVPLKNDSFYTKTWGIANLHHCTIGNCEVDNNFL